MQALIEKGFHRNIESDELVSVPISVMKKYRIC